MDNFFTDNKISSNYSRTYSKGKSFKFSVGNNKDTYNNDEFVQDGVIHNGVLYVCLKNNCNIAPKKDSEFGKELLSKEDIYELQWNNFEF